MLTYLVGSSLQPAQVCCRFFPAVFGKCQRGLEDWVSEAMVRLFRPQLVRNLPSQMPSWGHRKYGACSTEGSDLVKAEVHVQVQRKCPDVPSSHYLLNMPCEV